MILGSSPRSDVYLINDDQVAETHAVLRAAGDHCEIEAQCQDKPLLVNNATIRLARLRHGDQITVGRTVFVFEQRQG
ncbi:MAG: FHA domain-containing protein [Candidatus Riflebacteria bacterium]|nr:FHA domain-containing protein [Candidatus Riflebacteria bacterium]